MAGRRFQGARTPPLVTAHLREELVRAEQPLRVDEAKGIIYGVKILGRRSPNRHGLKQVTKGTEYTRDALRQAARIYEGLKVNINHDRSKGQGDRSAYDRFGKFQNVRDTDDGLFGDLKYLKPHSMAQNVVYAAKEMPDAFAMSHDAYGRGHVKDGTYVVGEIKEALSVDVVADGGTVTSLFESRNRTMQTTVAKLWESLSSKFAAKRAKALVRLLEDEMMAEAPLDEPAPSASSDAQAKDAFRAMVIAAFDDDSLDAMATAAKIKDILKAYEKLVPPEAPAGSEDAVEDEEEEEVAGSGEGDEEEEEEEAPVSESRRRQTPRGTKRLREQCERLCKIAGVKADKRLLESLVAMRDTTAIMDHLDWLKEQGTTEGAAPAKGPRSQSPGGTKRLQESRDAVPEKPAELVAFLRN